MYYIDPKNPNAPVVNRGENRGYPEHFHANIELIHIASGERRVTINGESYSEPCGSLTVVFPFLLHSFEFVSEGEYYCLGVNPRFLPGISGLLYDYVPSVPVITADKLGRSFELMKHLFSCPRGTDPGVLNSLATALILELRPLLSLTNRTQSGIGSDLLGMIASRCAESDFTLDKLSRLTGINTRTLSGFFMSSFGMSFSAFLRKYRLNTAVRLLESDTRMTMTNVAFESGFSSVRTFNRVFREEFGISPSEYRR